MNSKWGSIAARRFCNETEVAERFAMHTQATVLYDDAVSNEFIGMFMEFE